MYKIGFFGYWWKFITSPQFQEQQMWMQPVMNFFGLLPPNVWTSMRFPGGFITCWLMHSGYMISSLVVFLLFVLTDWADGKSARIRKGITANGGILDGTADKFLVLPVAAYLSWRFNLQLYSYWTVLTPALLLLMVLSEVSRVFMPLSRRFDKKKHFHAIDYGKYKFGVQVTLIVMLWLAVFVFPHWPWWPIWISLFLVLANVLSIFSIVFRLYPEFEKYAADVISMGNLTCGALAILFASASEFKTSVALIAIAGVLDMGDGFVARKTKPPKVVSGLSFGDIADDVGDFVSFALAPAAILFFLNQGIISVVAAIMYLIATTRRLVFFTLQGIRGRSVPGVFQGLPSPAAAIFFGSFLLWEHPIGHSVLPVIGMMLAILEVSFFIRWFHFRLIFQTPKRERTLAGIFAIMLFLFVGSGEALSAMIFLYFVFFLVPVAEACWGWNRG